MLSVCTLILGGGHAQIFPFSNLHAFFDTKTKVDSEAPKSQPDAGLNISRPYRQTDHNGHLPPLHEFDSPDIFTINREIDNHRSPTIKKYPTSTEPPPLSAIPARRRNKNKYHARIEQSTQPTIPEDPSGDLIFITPRPKSDHRPEQLQREHQYSKVVPKRVRGRKPNPFLKAQHPTEPTGHDIFQATFDNEQITNPISELHSPLQSATKLLVNEPTIVESLPSHALASKENEFDSDIDLVDYLVPPKLPSVYEKNLKSHKRTGSQTLRKQKPLPSTSFSKKENRYRNKKHRGEIAPIGTHGTRVPVTDRLTTKPKRMVRRRPSHHLIRESPLREPVLENNPTRQVELENQAQLMDEQITAETGFTGEASQSHPRPGERVEFQMHGQKGPHSYKFGYDTGKGHNRQFRFEEKDNHGHVKGHYGFYDKEGKLQVVNYEADPEHGFKAEAV